MTVVLRATWTAREGCEEAVLAALASIAAASRHEPGCRLYQPYRDPAEPRVFHIFEIYDDEAALEAHGASEHFKTHVLEQAVPLLENRERAVFETIDV
jgi:quinol monooxygenase YgiN